MIWLRKKLSYFNYSVYKQNSELFKFIDKIMAILVYNKNVERDFS